MNSKVAPEIEPREKSFFTDEALEPIVANMDRYVLVQVGLLGETLAAAVEVALEGTLTRVRAQVVEQVVPLSEALVALGAIGVMHSAHQRLQHAVGVGVLRFED